MYKKVTKYLKQVLIDSEHPVIPFKDNDFVSFTFDEFLENSYDINETDPLCNLLNNDEYNKLFIKCFDNKGNNNIQVQIKCVVSYKTLKTNFFSQKKSNKNIDDLTGVYYFPFTINMNRTSNGVNVSYGFNNEETPWYARCFITPKYIQSTPCVSSIEKVDKYLSNTTEDRAKIKNWKDYVKYCDELFCKTANQELKYEDKCFVFRYDIDRKNIIGGLVELYDYIISHDCYHKLYNNAVDLNFSETVPLLSNDEMKNSKIHCGQMSGEYPLAYSQRQAVHHMNAIENGEILAVSGPPGTGKTTLLQSIVSDMVVKSALNSDDPPVIVAISANNQAVTNIIDSFSSINNTDILNLDKRWVNCVKSFATYMPSVNKAEEAKSNGYQYTSIKNREFISDAENNIVENINCMNEKASAYFGEELCNVNVVKAKLEKELKEIDALKNQLISLCVEVSNLTNEKEIIIYIEELNIYLNNINEKELKCKNRLHKWNEIYNNISKFKRVFSFIPYFNKQITNILLIEQLPEEIDFLSSEITISKIQDKYSEVIYNLNKEISKTNEKINKAQKLLDEVTFVLSKLEEKNCDLNLLTDGALEKFKPSDIDDLIDKNIRYVEFWLAVHIYECRFLLEKNPISKKQEHTNYKSVLKNFYKRIALLSPCFVMTTFRMPSNFKCCEGGYLFDFADLLIFDEAGQCSPEIAMANFSLAKKAIVVGDEYQIQPVYNTDIGMDITLAIQNELIENDEQFESFIESGLSCSQGSVMRIAKKSCKFKLNENVRGLFLCEHRRCYDQIINYCNELVYDGLLVPKRNSDELERGKKRILSTSKYPYMGICQINSGSSTSRGSSRVNEVEATKIVSWLQQNYKEICDEYKNDNPDIDLKNVLAIITPFSAQTTIIKKELKSKMKKDAENISVGTVHTFQGGERNVIIFSTVYGKTDGGAFIENNKNLMNVAVSRAKDAFIVFGDCDFLNKKSKSTAVGLLYEKIKDNDITI